MTHPPHQPHKMKFSSMRISHDICAQGMGRK